MIKIGKISEMNQELYNENWMIVRKPKEIPDYVKLEPLLAPSQELFDKYRSVFRAGKYTQEYFDQVYVPQFLEELAKNEDALALLKDLVSVIGGTDGPTSIFVAGKLGGDSEASYRKLARIPHPTGNSMLIE